MVHYGLDHGNKCNEIRSNCQRKYFLNYQFNLFNTYDGLKAKSKHVLIIMLLMLFVFGKRSAYTFSLALFKYCSSFFCICVYCCNSTVPTISFSLKKLNVSTVTTIFIINENAISCVTKRLTYLKNYH